MTDDLIERLHKAQAAAEYLDDAQAIAEAIEVIERIQLINDRLQAALAELHRVP